VPSALDTCSIALSFDTLPTPTTIKLPERLSHRPWERPRRGFVQQPPEQVFQGAAGLV
jgi:hypothetical protein